MSFDIKAAREICSRIKGYEDPDGGNSADFQAAEMLPAALDEIERLQKALALKTEQHKGQADVIGSYLGMLTDFNELNESQTKRIAELNGKLKTATQYDDLHIEKYNHAMRKISKLHAALKKLGQAKRERGKAMVEERAYAIECNPNRTREWTHAQAIERAREQLRQEGKL